MHIRLSRVNVGMVLVGILLSLSNRVHAGTLYGLDDPDRIPGEFMVRLKRERVVSLEEPMLADHLERATRSLKWQAANLAVDAEVAQRAAKLVTTHRARLSFPVMGASLIPNFTIDPLPDREDHPGRIAAGSNEIDDTTRDLRIIRAMTRLTVNRAGIVTLLL